MRKEGMARRKLTDEERHFRKIGSGIPFTRWWPVVGIFLAVLFAALNSSFVTACTGMPLDAYGALRSARIAMLFAYPCSPYLLQNGLGGWLIFLGLWTPWPFVIVNWRWARRQRKFWDGERLREAERRKAKRAAETFESE